MKSSSIDQYIAEFNPDIQERLTSIREIFHTLIPNCDEKISYAIPSFQVGSSRLYFAGFKHHIGFYPVHNFKELQSNLIPYLAKGTKGTLHFPHSQPLPTELIKKIIQYTLKKSTLS